ncbi:MAG TPA: efflux RND transporter periplasmic adaptor subunit [Acidobacteriaceae bacterium]|nr:efflux RND transporter periplasmic adaptor subunit [Acidobacteriaceae bacterium]
MRFRVFSLGMAMIVASVLIAMSFGCSSENTVPPPEPVVSVETVHAKVRSIADVVTAEGVLYPVHQASISPKITAPVRKFYVQRGDKVHRGELLAVLENKDLTAAVVSAQGEYDQAQATYASTTSSALPEEIQTANLNVVNTKANLAAQRKLYDSENKLYQQGAIARKQLDATEVALTAAQSAYKTAEKHLQNLQSEGVSQQRKAAQGQLELAHGQYLGAAAQLGYTEIRSPVDGVVADRAVYPGDIAPAGTPLLIVMDTSKVVVRLHVPQQQAELLQLGQAATMRIPGLDKDVPAKVTVLSPALDPNSTTEEIWVEADNRKGELKPGTTAQVSITAQTVANALVIPAAAILTGPNGQTSVMVVKSDNRAYPQDVKTGIQQGTMIQISSGLEPGEQVIVSGQYGLPDKTKVKATPASASSGKKAEA